MAALKVNIAASLCVTMNYVENRLEDAFTDEFIKYEAVTVTRSR